MKKLYLRILLISVHVFTLYVSVAQVTVAASSGDMGPVTYTTLKAAFDAINLGTHTGAITISLTNGTTEVASAVLKGDGQQSASYTSVLIKPGAGTNPVVSGNSSNSIIVLDGANNVHIDGSNELEGISKNLIISNTTGSGISFINGASNNFIHNSIFKSGSDNSGTINLSGSNTSSGNNYNTIENNDITGHPGNSPHYGIFNTGTSGNPNTGNIYRNNRIFDFTRIGFADGDLWGSIGYSDNTLLEGNEIYSTITQPFQIGIVVTNPIDTSQMTISGNIIHSLSSSSGGLGGIHLEEAGSVTVINNFISLSNTASSISGIVQLTEVGADIKIYHNTVEITGFTSTGIGSSAFYKNSSSTDDEIYNNIFINTRITSGAQSEGHYAFLKANTGSYRSDFNNLVSIGNDLNYVAGESETWPPTQYSSLADWQAGTGQDAHSISVTPVFVSSSDLHVVPDSNMALDNLGMPIAEVGTDIDGEPRSTLTPDMGADEFTSSGGTAVTDLDESISSVVLMPNLVNNNTTLCVIAHRDRMITWIMVDIEGTVVMTFEQHVSSGQNDFQLNLTHLAPGTYQIIGQTAKGRTGITRFIKLM